MNSEIAEAFSQIIKEKNLDKEQLSSIVHSTVIGMIKKKYGSTDNFDVYISLDKGEMEIHQTKVIVEEVKDSVVEIDLESAQKIEPDLEMGDEFLEIINPISFGRRLIISAKQNLNQRIGEEEKKIVSDEFETRIGEIIMGDIRQISRGDVFLNIDHTEVILPRREQIHSERYRRGDHVRAIIKEVRRSSRGPEIIVSRSDRQFLIRLFELEVPEIYDGIIEIKEVVRQPGERSKIAVYSNDKRIDAVGACVGMKGIRIQAVSKELNNEKVDVIPWSHDLEVFITRALSPAKPIRVLVDSPNSRAIAVLPDDQVSLGIGRGGQNRKLTGRLTGLEIEIVKESEYRKMIEAKRGKNVDLEFIDGFSETILSKLDADDIITVNDILKIGENGLKDITGIGEKTAIKIWTLVQEFIAGPDATKDKKDTSANETSDADNNESGQADEKVFEEAKQNDIQLEEKNATDSLESSLDSTVKESDIEMSEANALVDQHDESTSELHEDQTEKQPETESSNNHTK